MATLTTFSATRFANSIKNVTINVRLDYQAINQCLKTIIENLSKKTSEEDRKKLQDAVLLLKASENKQFCLQLSGISDIYEVYGHMANACQIVNLLPFERFDLTSRIVDELKQWQIVWIITNAVTKSVGGLDTMRT